MCQSSSSQRSCARRHASHSQRLVRSAAVGLAECAQRPRQRFDGRRIPVGEPRHEGVKELVGRDRGLSGVGGARCFGDLTLVWAGPEATGEHCRGDRLEVGLAGHRGVQGLEPLGCREQQRRRVASASAGERDLRAQPLQPRALEVIERSELGGGQEVGRGRGVGDVELCLRSGERALDARGGVGCQLGGPRQECCGRGQPAACLCPVG